MLLECRMQVGEDDALARKLFIYTNEGRLGVVLDEQGRVLLSLLDEPLDGLREVSLSTNVRARGVGEEVLYPHVGDVRVAPRLVPEGGHGRLLEGAPRFETFFGEPARLVLKRRKRFYGLRAYALAFKNLRHAVRAHVSSFSLVSKTGRTLEESAPRKLLAPTTARVGTINRPSPPSRA